MDKYGKAHELRQRVDAAVDASKANRFFQVGGKPLEVKNFATPTPTPTPSGTGPTPTPSPTKTPFPTPVVTLTPGPTPTNSATPTLTPTVTPTPTQKVNDFIQLEGMHEHLLLQEDEGRLIIERVPPTPTPTPTPTASPFPQICVSNAGLTALNGQYEYGFWSIGALGTLPGYRLTSPYQTYYIFKNQFNQPNTWDLVIQQPVSYTLEYVYYNTDISKPTVPLSGWQSIVPQYNPPPFISSSPCPSQTPFPTSTQTPTPTQTTPPNPFVWQARVLPVISSWTKLGANPEAGGYYIAIAGGTPLVSRSLNGQTWSIEQNPSGSLLVAKEVEYGNGWFVFVTGTGTGYVASSNEGISWPTGSIFPNSLAGADITWGPNGFVVPSNSPTQALVSMNPLTGFSVVNLPFTGGFRNWRCTAYGGGKYVILGLDGIAAGVYSTDANNWTPFALPSGTGRYISVAYGNGRFVAVSDLTSEVIYSDDGINWTRVFVTSALSTTSKKIVYGNGKFLVIPNSGDSGSYSFDGVNWYNTLLPVQGTSWNDVIFANNRFMLLPGNTGNLVYVYDDNVPTPTPTQSGTPTPTPTPSSTSPTATPTPTLSPTPTPSPSPSPTVAIIEDSAANYVTFNNASNQGFGFQPWSITTVNNAGQYLFSTVQRGMGNIDTVDKSWASYANPAGFNINRLNRTVQTPLTQGQLLSAAIAVAYRNGNKGIRIKEQGTNGRVVWEFAVTNDTYRVSAVTPGQTWPVNLTDPSNPSQPLPYSQTSIFDVYVYCQAPLIYNIGLHRRGNGLLSTTTLTALADTNTFEFYIENTEQGNALNDLYFNSIKVASYTPPPTPTPSPSPTPTQTATPTPTPSGTVTPTPTPSGTVTPTPSPTPTPTTTLPLSISLLMHMDGTQNSQSFVDSSLNNFPVTVLGSTYIDTTTKKFGTGAAYFDGIGNMLELPLDSAFDFGSQDFTIELWAYTNSTNAGTLLARWGYAFFIGYDNTNGVNVYLNNSYVGGSGGPMPYSQWNHIAVVRNGTNILIFINGVLTNTHSIGPITIQTTANKLRIGGDHYGNAKFNGYIDEVRITKGTAVYISNFTPPNSPFLDPVPLSPTPTPTQSGTPTPTPSPTASPTPSGTATPTPSPSPTSSPTPTPTPTVTTYAVYAANFVPLEITNSGLSYNISQFGTNNPPLTCYRGTNYDFIPISLGSHPFALRAALGDTSTSIAGTFNNNPSTGIVGSRMYFTPQSSTPNTIYYQCTVHSSMSGVISILDY